MSTVKEDRPVILVLEGLSGASEAVDEAGGESWSIYPGASQAERVKAAFDSGVIEGLLLTGGGDVDPRRYGQTASKQVYGVNEDRDTIEYYALGRAYVLGIPIMGICRGSQIMNVFAGGTLYQHVPARYGRGSDKHKCGTLPVATARRSRVRKAMGNNVYTTHLHHQSVRKVGKGYKASAHDPDHGIVEAIESLPNEPWRVGVQFHPEMATYEEPERGLFREFVLAAAEWAGLPVPTVRPPKPVETWADEYARVRGMSRRGWDEWDEEWSPIIGGKSVPDANVKYANGVTTVTYDNDGNPVEELDPYQAEHEFAEEVCELCHTPFDFQEDYFDHLEFVHNIVAGGKAVIFSGAPLALEGKKVG